MTPDSLLLGRTLGRTGCRSSDLLITRNVWLREALPWIVG